MSKIAIAFFVLTWVSSSAFADHKYRFKATNLDKSFRNPEEKVHLYFESRDKHRVKAKTSDLALYFSLPFNHEELRKSKWRAKKRDFLESLVKPEGIERKGTNLLTAAVGLDLEKLPSFLFKRAKTNNLHQPDFAFVESDINNLSSLKVATASKGFFKSVTFFLNNEFSVHTKLSEEGIKNLYQEGHVLRGKTQLNLVFVGDNFPKASSQLRKLVSHLQKLGIPYSASALAKPNNKIEIHTPAPFKNTSKTWNKLFQGEKMKSSTLAVPKTTTRREKHSEKEDFPQPSQIGEGISSQGMNTGDLGNAIFQFETEE